MPLFRSARVADALAPHRLRSSLRASQSGWYTLSLNGSAWDSVAGYSAGMLFLSDASSSAVRLTRSLFLSANASQPVLLVLYQANPARLGQATVAVAPAVAASTVASTVSSACPAGANGAACGGSVQGRCALGQCFCNPRFRGASCDSQLCRTDDCADMECRNLTLDSTAEYCGGRGTCGPLATCTACDGNLSPRSNCMAPASCPANCSGRGQCVNGGCQCNAGFDGADCGLDVCGAGQAVRPGLVANFYSIKSPVFQPAAKYRQLLYREIVPAIDESWDQRPVRAGADVPFVADWAGLLRPFHNGTTGLRCRRPNGVLCRVLLNGLTLDSSANFTAVAGSALRLKVEYQVIAPHVAVRAVTHLGMCSVSGRAVSRRTSRSSSGSSPLATRTGPWCPEVRFIRSSIF